MDREYITKEELKEEIEAIFNETNELEEFQRLWGGGEKISDGGLMDFITYCMLQSSFKKVGEIYLKYFGNEEDIQRFDEISSDNVDVCRKGLFNLIGVYRRIRIKK